MPKQTARRRRASALAACWLAALVALACNKGPAQEALAAAEQALAAAPEIQAHAPEEAAAIALILRDAHASFEAGHYTDALRAALPLSDRIAAAAQSAGKRKQQAAATWSVLSTELEPRLQELHARLEALSLGGAVSSERLLAAQQELTTLDALWAEATGAFARGDVARAVAVAQDARAQADSLGVRLGLKRTPLPEPAR